MRFRIHAPDTSHGIRVIDEIPDIPLCRIEGRNGIGKTLAVHLLELCTGQQPYAARSDAWRTLCEYLGPTTVTIDGLRSSNDEDLHNLEFVFDWRGRANAPLPVEIDTSLFDAVTLDGVDVQMDEVRRWLTVVRIAGDETLTETIAGLVAHDRELLRTASRVALARGRYVDGLLDALLEPFSREIAERALVVAQELAAIHESRAGLITQRERQAEAVAKLEAALMARAAAAEVTDEAEALDKEMDSLTSQLEAARERRSAAEAELAAAWEEQQVSENAATKLASARRTFTRRLNAVKRAEETIANASTDLGVGNDEAAVRTALEELNTQRSTLAEQRADLADLFALRDLLESLVQALAPAAAGGLRARTIATLGDRVITAGDLLDAVRVRRERLTAEAPAVEELDRSLAELDAREQALRALFEAMEDRVDKQQKLAEAEIALQELDRSTDSEAETVSEKAAAQAAAQRVEIELGSALGALQRQRARLGGGLSLADLVADLERRLADADTTEDTLDTDLRSARAVLVALDDRLDSASARQEELGTEAAVLEQSLASQTQQLHGDHTYAQLREALGERAPRISASGEDLAHAWLAVHAAQDRTVQRLQSSRSGLDAAVSSMNELVDVIREKREASPDLDRIRRLYQERLQDRFAQDEIVSALFDGGTLTRVDLAAREIRWRTPDNEPRVRPFEAFSSGERAFAYVQARLAGISQVTAQNRVVAVDEFGAFLSHDRLTRLRLVVQRQLNDNLIDQAIVVLPLGTITEVTANTSETELSAAAFDALPA